MSDSIDVNDKSTYPIDVINMLKNEYNEEKFTQLLNKYFFLCSHVTNTFNIDNYYNNGIQRPFIASNQKNGKINYKLKNIILDPLKKSKNYEYYSKKYDEVLEKEYIKNKSLINDWYGKYSCVCFVLDEKKRINLNNPVYEPLIKYYGGELLRDIGISEEELKQIGANTKAYAIFFKIPYNDLKFKIDVKKLYEHMKLIYNNEDSIYECQGYVNRDISHSDFIKIKELKINE